MSQDSVKCPKCGEIIKITEAMQRDIELVIKKRYEKEMEVKISEQRAQLTEEAKKKAFDEVSLEMADLKGQVSEQDKKIKNLEQQELELRKRERQIKDKEESFEKDLEAKEKALIEKFDREKKEVEEKARLEEKKNQETQASDLREQLKEKDSKLEEARQAELELRKKNREYDDRVKNLELEVERTLDAERSKIAEKVARDMQEKHQLKDAEKDKQLAGMKVTIEELKRKAEQGSQQRQGEVLELALEKSLEESFPFDEIQPIPKGVKGGDVIQVVKTQSGKVCGKIMWEAKRTKSWSDTWIQKLKDNQREAKAEMAVLVSEALPQGFRHFRKIDEIWVTDVPTTLSLALALRTVLIQVSRTREIQTGKEEKQEVVYNYLTGTEFKNRVQAIIESFLAMKKDLDAEKRAMTSIWAKREKQMDRVVLNIAGMRGDLEGIVGSSLPSVKILELPSEKEEVV